MILVTKRNLAKSVRALAKADRVSIDTETSGLLPYHGDKLFSIIVADKNEEYYFDFHKKTGMPRNLIREVSPAFANTQARYYFINAKFDLAILRNDKIDVVGRVIDGSVIARVDWNNHPERYLSMDYLLKYYLKRSKDDQVKKYIKENGLYKLDYYGEQADDYQAVPLKLMFPYGCHDARDTFDICEKILQGIIYNDKRNAKIRPHGYETLVDLVRREVSLTKTLFKIETRGINVDEKYTKKAFNYEFEKGTHEKAEIEKELGININSSKQMASWLIGLGYELPKTEKGNYMTGEKILYEYCRGNPHIDRILGAKKSLKKANTYYKNFLDLRDPQGILHCSLNQDVARTGRLSCSKPNLQNLTKEAWTGKEKYLVRKSIIATRGRKLFMFDYKQQEMHIMIDSVGEMSVLDKMRDSFDFYEATAKSIEELTGVKISRFIAKQLSLALAYGQGSKKLARTLGVTVGQAIMFKRAYFRALPKLREFSRYLESCVKQHGRIFSPMGRVFYIDPGFAYKSINAFSQGTAADVMKEALNKTEDFLEDYKSNLVLTVHDELIIDMVPRETKIIVPKICELMSAVYPHRHIPLKVAVEYGETSWGTKVQYKIAA